MATIKMMLYNSKKLTDGNNPIMLRITHKNERKYFGTGLSATSKQWDDTQDLFKRDKRLTPDYEYFNELIIRKVQKAKQIIDDFDKAEINFTLKQFETKFCNTIERKFVAEYFRQYINSLNDQNRFGYATVFEHTLKTLTKFDVNFEKNRFQDIDSNYIEKFESYLKYTRKVKDTTISIHMRSIRTILIDAIKEGIGSKESYPFTSIDKSSKKSYSISKLETTTKKRFIPTDFLRIIKEAEFENPSLSLAKNLFLFSFYCRGINWKDMALLKKDNIKNEVTENGRLVRTIEYIRAKTKKRFVITINNDIENLLNWFDENYPEKEYLLPCISRKNLNEKELINHLKNRRHRYNDWLKVVTQKLDFPEALIKISSYYSRHSYAMRLREKGESDEIIQENMGHQELKTTKIYLDSFGLETLAKSNENLI